jgi:hypothetical protein
MAVNTRGRQNDSDRNGIHLDVDTNSNNLLKFQICDDFFFMKTMASDFGF